jgi:hypothetical protein
LQVVNMLRRVPFFFTRTFRALAICGLTLAAVTLAGGQEPQAASSQAKTGDQAKPADQAKTKDQAKTGDQAKTEQSKPADSNVFVLKAPEMPAQPQMTPELRAVDLEKRGKLGATTRAHLIQLLDAEFVRVRRYFPLGDKSMTIDPQGRVTPTDTALFQQAQAKGMAAKVGDKVQITNVRFHDKAIIVELNGGGKKKTKWYQHISVGVGGAGGGVTPIDGTEAQVTGAGFTLLFNKQIPEMTYDDLKKLLSPVLDFTTKTASQVYSETLPPKVRDAIKKHEVLVGMNRDMVVAAKDRPISKSREKDENGKEYEDWMYGQPPQDVIFVRFIGDEVTMVKITRPGSENIYKTKKEVDVKEGAVSLAAIQSSNSPEEKAQHPEEEQPTRKPTLIREGETPETPVAKPGGQPQLPSRPDEPEWGTGGKQPPPPQDPPKPPE